MDASLAVNPQVKIFLYLYLPQRNILRDFYELLSEKQYDFRLPTKPDRHSDSPRESLAHILEYRLLCFNAIKSGMFEFKSMGVESYKQATKQELLAAWDQIEEEMLTYCNQLEFDDNRKVVLPWGEWNVIETLSLIRDHEILHVGWNLALMDMLGMKRFTSLSDYWG